MEAARNLEGPPVGANIRLARRLAGRMGQRELARLAGLTQSRLSDYENGRHVPDWDRVVEIARHTGITDPGWFYSDHSDLASTLDREEERYQ